MIESIVVASSLFGMSEEAKEMGAKFAAMKAKTHQTLTAAKDISSLVARIDKDLLALSKKKQELFALKNSLLAKKNELLFLIELKKTDFSRLQAAYNTTQADIKLQVESLNALETQKSITTEVQAVDHLPSRATLLAQAFEKKQMRENIAVEVEHKFEEDFYG
ncbi:hypothetical protein FJ364_05665 [Candidatus Dependentiae bacterium]|nr:hypothetical protein [Candidatus Dependentiae bacterium]